MMLNPNDPILRLYQSNLRRNPDKAGYEYYSRQLAAGVSANTIAENMRKSAEAMGTAPPPTDVLGIYDSNSGGGNGGGSNIAQIDTTAVTDAVSSAMANAPTFDDLSAVNGNINTGFATTNQNMNSGFSNTNQNINSGFSDTNQSINTGFNNVGNQISGVGNAVDSGFAAMSNGLTNTGQALADQANANTNTVLGGQSALNDTLTSAANDLRTNQQSMTGQLAAQGTNMAQYYADLMQGQQGLGGDIGAFASDFGSFNDQYNTDVTAATAARTQTQDMINGGFDQVQSDMQTNATAMQNSQSNLMEAVGGARMGLAGSPTATTAPSTTTAGFASVDGMAQPPQGQGNPVEGSIAAGVTSIRQNLPALLSRINPSAQKNMVAMVGSFNDQGGLIPTSTDGTGNVITRVMDRSGVLTLRGQDAAGNIVGQNQISVPQMFQLASAALRG